MRQLPAQELTILLHQMLPRLGGQLPLGRHAAPERVSSRSSQPNHGRYQFPPRKYP
jgi:hypothetical protein